MGQAGKALKKVLETYDISQYRLAAALGVGRSNVYRWVNEIRDPTAELSKMLWKCCGRLIRRRRLSLFGCI
jgi:plasmid maintenance system antidote protein VapI